MGISFDACVGDTIVASVADVRLWDALIDTNSVHLVWLWINELAVCVDRRTRKRILFDDSWDLYIEVLVACAGFVNITSDSSIIENMNTTW